ncbi:MAG: hypothetical protein JSV80_09175 [Acidobacteriota bacterium]|nr:MAG: hypothetical protein JSV80_09175 [Acidobacteriota bacterium]
MIHTKSRTGAQALIAVVAALVLLAASVAQAATLANQNLTQLITDSESIVEGTVKSVTDGIDENGLPYTEVTIAVNSTAKGNIEGETEYTFRQFGLLEPRTLEDGTILLTVSPAGFARWHEGESVIAFLHRPATRTGLQTTAGLAQGKLARFDSNTLAANEFGNAGLFEGVWINPELTTPEEKNMLTTAGPVDAGTFMNLVHRAVFEQWIENGEMR